MTPRPTERQARQDQVAEALSRAPGAGNVDAPADDGLVSRKRACEGVGLIFAAASREVGKSRCDLLQARDVGIGDALELGGDARRIDDAVDAAAPLHIPAHDPHCGYARVWRTMTTTLASSR